MLLNCIWVLYSWCGRFDDARAENYQITVEPEDDNFGCRPPEDGDDKAAQFKGSWRLKGEEVTLKLR